MLNSAWPRSVAESAPGVPPLCALLGLLWSAGCGGGSPGIPSPSSPSIKSPPTLTKAYGAASVPLNGATSLTFTLTNPNSAASLSGVGFTDRLPAGQVVATPSGLMGSCGGGAVTAVAGSSSLSLSSASLAASASCSFAVNVMGTVSGAQTNTTSAVTSIEAGNGGTASANLVVAGPSQQPPQPTDITPIDGQVYYILNQPSDLQVDLNSNSTTVGDHLLQEAKSFTNTSQRWTFTKVSGGWQISNVQNGLCADSANVSGVLYVVQNACLASTTSQQWTLSPTNNGYYTIANDSTNLLMDVPSASAGAFLEQTQLSGSATQSQQWLLRPAFFRGVDNALLEKQESARISTGLTWWKDAGVEEDVLQILKNHGVNLVRVRPSSAPPYSNPSQSGCTGNACFAETEAQDLDLAKRAKNLGLSLELTLLFDGGGSASVPPAWAGHTLNQLQTDIYSYVKAEILLYRQSGTMPDLVSIGNEVDTGFLGSIGSPTGTDFGGFAALQIQAMQAVRDAAADTSMGPAIAAPLTCIHITPAWDLTQFFTLANQNSVPYDAICQSYYPLFQGPLTDAQAAAANPNHQPVEQDVLVAAANNIGKPIFLIEVGEHYENGFQSNDPWYSPPSPQLQAQFLRDLQSVQQALPNNLGLGLAYWDPEGVNIPRLSGGLFNGGTNQPDAIYVWNGLTIFDNADTAGTTNVNDPNYSTPLPALDALGGR
jgi:arabinogalactan endo-1,4-beta-galactosidase